MKTRYFLFLFLFLVTFGACNDPKHVTEPLHRAEALMNEDPDSAWAVLNTLSPDEMGQNRNRALYALLYTQAQDKTYHDETNDSLISVAVDYYRHTDDVRRKFLSFYYKGRVHFNAKDYLNATSCYMEAEQLADAVGDDYLAGLLYAELGRIYRLYYDYPKSLEAYQKAAECYECAGKIRHRNYMWLNKSSICRNMNLYVECEKLLLMALAEAKREKDYALVAQCLGDLTMLYIKQHQMSKAHDTYAELRMIADSDFGSPSFLCKVTQLYASEGNFVQAQKSLEQGWNRATDKTDSINLYIASATIYSLQGKSEEAYQLMNKGVSMQNEEARLALQQPILTAQRDYLSEKLEFEAYRLRVEKQLRLLYVLFFILLWVVLAFVFSRMLKKKKATIDTLGKEKDRVESENRTLLQQLENNKKEADRTIEKLKNEIAQKEKQSNAEISVLFHKLERGENSLEDLKLMLSEKEENRQEMEALIQKLETDSEANTAALACLRAEMEALQELNHKMLFQKVELLKHVLEHVAAIVYLHEERYTKEETKEKKIREGISILKKNYFAGENEYRKVEDLVNQYLDNAMYHFRKEVNLPNEADYRRVCYMFAGVSGQVIGQIMNESKDAVYQRKSRLLKKIATLPCVYKEMFMELLCK